MSAMTDDDRDLLKTLAAERDIKAALARFCRGADRKDYELLRTAFHDDAWDDHGAYRGDVDGFIAWQKPRHENIEQCMHLIGNCLIEIDGDEAFTETYCLAVLHSRDTDDTYKRTSIACRYVDRFENRGPGWRIAHRVVVYDWAGEEQVAAVLPAALPQARRSKEDVIYHIRTLKPGPRELAGA